MLQQLRPGPQDGGTPLAPLLLVVNKVDLAPMFNTSADVQHSLHVPCSPPDGNASPHAASQPPDTIPTSGTETVTETITVTAPCGVAGSSSPQTQHPWLASDICGELIPASVAARVSGTVATSAVTGGGLDHLKAAVLSLTHSPDIATGTAATLHTVFAA